jgi:hypothetical protein
MHRCPIARSGRRPAPAARIGRGVCALAFTLLTGCATYHTLPLPAGDGARSVGQLSAPLPQRAWLPAHHFDPADGLDVTELATLAVANNPDLRSRRDALGVARAQAFAAGLLPDPQLGLGADFPRSNAADLTTAYSASISADLGALLARSTRVAAAHSQAQQVNLDLLWAEWQTVAQARLLFDQVTTLQARQLRLQHERDALAPLAAQVQAVKAECASAVTALRSTLPRPRCKARVRTRPPPRHRLATARESPICDAVRRAHVHGRTVLTRVLAALSPGNRSKPQ